MQLFGFVVLVAILLATGFGALGATGFGALGAAVAG
jgi:hypothetical protein